MDGWARNGARVQEEMRWEVDVVIFGREGGSGL